MFRKILIRTPNYVGDTIMATPALCLLRNAYPEARLTILCSEGTEQLLRHRPEIENIITDRRHGNFLRLARSLRASRFDLGILFRNSFRDAALFKIAGVKNIAGYTKDGNAFLLDQKLKLERGRHLINQYVYLINVATGTVHRHLPPVALHHQPSGQIVRSNGRPIIGVAIGGPNKGTKYYPTEKGQQLLVKLVEHGCDIVLLGDDADREGGKAYREALSGFADRCTDLIGHTDLAELIDCISALDLLITIDSAPMHIAAAVGTPFIVLVGKSPSPFDRTKPKVTFGGYIYGATDLVLDEDIMASIAVEDVVTATLQQLQQFSRLTRSPAPAAE